ncbi:uncharacterized protein LOC144129949 [Amblyomma americanum]
MLLVTGAFHASSVAHSPVGFTLILVLLVFSGLCIIFSMVLLIGLLQDNRLLLIPWIAVVTATTLLDVALSLYFVKDMRITSFVVVMYVIDYTLCSVNVYAILCVLSQYQEYASGRREIGKKTRAALPVLSGCQAHADWPKLNSTQTRPRRAQPQPQPKSVHVVPASTQGAPQAAVVSGDKVVPLENKLVPQVLPVIPEATSAFPCGPEEISSSVPISTAETSLQPFAEEADARGNIAAPADVKLRGVSMEKFVPNARTGRRSSQGSTHDSTFHDKPVLDECLVLEMPDCSIPDESGDS